MNSNQLILDKFGQKLVEEVFELNYRILKSNFQDGVSQDKIEETSKEILSNIFFDFLRIFEETDDFKLYYESENKQVNLVEISEMLKSEPIIEGGWIERFSKE